MLLDKSAQHWQSDILEEMTSLILDIYILIIPYLAATTVTVVTTRSSL